MKYSTVTVSAIAAACVVALSTSFGLAQKGQPAPVDKDSNVGESIVGVPLPPENYGPGVVESWDDVEARAMLMPPETTNPKMRNGQQGKWVVPKPRTTFTTHSGIHNVTNTWGDTRMGIGFPEPVIVNGAFFAGQSAKGVWTTGIRAHGYVNGQLIQSTDWFHGIGETPEWFEMNLVNVDRIEIESTPVLQGGGWYSMDDFTFTHTTKVDKQGNPERVIIDFENCHWGDVLSGSQYAGLSWEVGTGDFTQAIPGPLPSDEAGDKPIAQEGNPGGNDGGGNLATAPNLIQNFQGPIFGGSFPPDTCGAAGPEHFVSVVNTNFSVYRKSDGVRIVNQTLSSFFGGGSGDPRILFDTHSNRWIAIDTDFSTRIYFAVSSSNNPTGTWFKTNFVVGNGLDFPTLGVDEKGIYISVWPTTGGTMTLLAIDKTPLVASPQSMGTINTFAGLPHDQAIQPAQHYGVPNPAGAYIISTVGSTGLRLRRVTWNGSSASLTSLATVSVPSYSVPPDAPAQGSATAIDTGDTRLVNAVFRDGFLYTTHTINVGGRAGVRWYKINPATSSLVDWGNVSDPVRSYFYPSIAVNSFGDLVMGFSGSSSSQFVASYYCGRAGTDPAGDMSAATLFRPGNASYQLVDNFGRNRWGDYSLTTLDPADDNSIWTIQEYVHSTNTWGTHIGKFVINSPPANNQCSSALTVGPGSYAFTTVFANTDGFSESACNFNGNSSIQNDIWYQVAATCTGTMTISLCGASFDTKLAVYPTSACPTEANTAAVCNEDFCGTSSQVSFPVTAGQIRRVRIGSASGATGTGTMVVSCTGEAIGACCNTDGSCSGNVTQTACTNGGGTFQGTGSTCGSVNCPQPCPADVTDDGTVNVADLLAVIQAWGACPGCAADINNDGNVNVADLLAVISAWGACP